MSLSKNEKAAGIVLVALLFLISLFSTRFFLGELKMGFADWIVFSSCSPVSYLFILFFLVFFIRRQFCWLVLTTLPVYYLGTLSMFVLPWTGTYLFAHAGHIIMTLSMFWALYVLVIHRQFKALATGLLLSILLFAPYIAHVQTYNQKHAGRLTTLLGNP
ncbi:hypothetical protein TBC1_12191 [Lentimicrobium saccharophilum]|uniref:Uncharacterized protein n=1 Tax=Lentimicrobium saccharophilum TaxID=1678841 RepID=A0A0S7C1D0_9BACT|nr:hypothetical protein [Lentimicrobium saccharophilum]GAP44386.1 hypothetical protein TBC1_12191 [Lentimicrobium saccharophilum]